MTEHAFDEQGWRVYQRVQAAVTELIAARAAAAGGAGASAYWTEELGNIDYLVEASPLIIRKLRHHAFHITGIRPYDYREKGDKREHVKARIDALASLGGRDLLVPESPALGGFGFAIDGALVNVDTVKFFEAMVALKRGGVLDTVRAEARPTVCEIGAGWGGFAYQFRTLVPKARYVIVDFAELFLFSATYLGTVFPEAKLAFCGTKETPTLADAADADIVFLPHTMAAQLATTRLDLAVNMISFQEMTGGQVQDYAATLAAAGCPLLYSFNRDRSGFNHEITSVTDALGTAYHLTEVPVLGSNYTTMLRYPPRLERKEPVSEFDYRHLVGRLLPSHGAARAAADGQPADVVLGMTLHNKATHLREALDSLLAQTYRHFQLVLLDDASSDGTEAIAREYAARDPRVHYHRHETRRGMVPTWREVVALARAEAPAARYFAWVSDHDRWAPQWLDRLLFECLAHPGTVLAYPVTRRLAVDGAEMDKGPRWFDTAGCATARERWSRFCRDGIGAGDMVYGLIRIDALAGAGVFRDVLRPDRLLVAELALAGDIRQVPAVLWYRRESDGASVDRQRHSLFVAGEEPRGFGAPPWYQHARALSRAYGPDPRRALGVGRPAWWGMVLEYQATYGWRHFRKTAAAHAIGRAAGQVVEGWKQLKHYWHHGVYHTLVGLRTARGRGKRAARRAVYEVLMLTHRLGLRATR